MFSWEFFTYTFNVAKKYAKITRRKSLGKSKEMNSSMFNCDEMRNEPTIGEREQILPEVKDRRDLNILA